jgi:hypothetical protein
MVFGGTSRTALGGRNGPVRALGADRAPAFPIGAALRVELNSQRKRKTMPLINIVIALIVIGVGLWLIDTYIPMASSIKTILNVVVVVSVVIWVLQVVGLWGRVTSYRLN